MKRQRPPKALRPKGAPHPPDVIGEQAISVRDELLGLAGVDKRRQADELRAALEEIAARLRGAPVVTRLVVSTGNGREEIVREFVDEDLALRLKAAGEMLSALGAYPSRSVGGSGRTAIQVNVVLRSMDEPAPRVKVVEGQSWRA